MKREVNTTHRVGRIFADYCGYCKMMKDDWDKMTAGLHSQGITVLNIQTDQGNNPEPKIKAINNTLHKDSIKLTYTTVPTIFAIHDGFLRYYTGSDRSAASLLEFATAKPPPTRKHKGGRTLSAMLSGGGIRTRRQRFRKSRHTHRFQPRHHRRRRRFTFAKARTEAWKYANDE